MRRSSRLKCETLEARDVPAVIDMTQLAQQFYPSPAQHAYLALNFDGWAGEGIHPFAGNSPNVDADIEEILDRVTEEFAPFNVLVRRVTGDGQHYASQGSTTIFIGDNPDSPNAWAVTPNDSTDYPQGALVAPNSHDRDEAFVDPVAGPGGTDWPNWKIAQAVCHEAGHTFGLTHIRTDGVDDDPIGNFPNNPPDVMSYDSPKQAFLNMTFNITGANLNPADGTSPISLYNRPWYDTMIGNYPVPTFMQTQNSFTYLSTILAPRDKDDVADVANAGAVDPGWADSPARVLKAWDTVHAQVDWKDDYDAFTFDAKTADPITVTVRPTAGSHLDPVLLIYDETAAGALVQFNNDIRPGTGASRLTFTPVPGHSYRFVVGGANEDSLGGYELKTFAGQVADGVLQLTGEPGTFTQHINIDALGSTLYVTVNGDQVAFPTKGLAAVTMATGPSSDTAGVYGTPKGIPFTLATGAGTDTVTVGRPMSSPAGGPRGYTLDGIGGPLTVDGGPQGDFGDHLSVLDTGTAAGHTYNLSADRLGRVGRPDIAYSNFEKLDLSTGAFVDYIYIRGTPVGTAVSVNSGAGKDTFYVGVPNSLTPTGVGTVQGPLSLDGEAGTTDKVLFDDTAEPAGQSYSLTGDHLVRSGAALIGFQGVEGVRLTGTAQKDIVTVDQVPPTVPVLVQGRDGDDGITVLLAPGGADVQVDGGAGTDTLSVRDAVGGAVLHTKPGAPGTGSVGVHYLTGPVGKVAYTTVEIEAQAPNADQSFVQALYHDVLGRDGSAAEVAGWLPTLQGPGGRAAVADGIERSAEARTATVTGWFLAFLNAPLTATELKTWAGVLAQTTEEDALRQLLNAAVTFAPGQPGKLQMQQFTALVYQQLLSRAPTAAEQKAAIGLLQKGAGELANAIETGAEYRKRAVRAAFESRLHRKPTASELAALAADSLDLRAIREQIESGPQYYDAGY